MRLAPITGPVDLQNCFNMQETMKYSFADTSLQTPVRVDFILFFNTFCLLLGCINKVFIVPIQLVADNNVLHVLN